MAWNLAEVRNFIVSHDFKKFNTMWQYCIMWYQSQQGVRRTSMDLTHKIITLHVAFKIRKDSVHYINDCINCLQLIWDQRKANNCIFTQFTYYNNNIQDMKLKCIIKKTRIPDWLTSTTSRVARGGQDGAAQGMGEKNSRFSPGHYQRAPFLHGIGTFDMISAPKFSSSYQQNAPNLGPAQAPNLGPAQAPNLSPAPGAQQVRYATVYHIVNLSHHETRNNSKTTDRAK